MNKITKDLLGVSCIIGAVGIFFARLFTPIPQLLVTQDLGRSDAWHFSFASKFALSESLENNQLPTWRSDIGDGFPLYAEGQTGALFIPNLLAFRFLDPIRAYALIMTLAIGSIAIGIYLWCRVMGFHPVAAYFAGITSAFCAYPIMQLPHITLLQGTGVMPYLLIATHMLIQSGRRVWMGLFALLLSQQIMAGFPQATFLTLILCCWYALWLCWKQYAWKRLWILLHAIALGIGGGAAQWLPSWEFLSYTTFPHGYDLQKAAPYSFPLKDLWSLFNPYAIGNPRLGIYPSSFSMGEGNIVWENTMYLGLAPLLFLIYVAWFHRRVAHVQFFSLTGLMALLFAWGKYSPVYLLYGIWPMNLFRVPSRFIWITILMLIMLAAWGVNALYKKMKSPPGRGAIVAVVAAHTIQLLCLWWNYNLLVPADRWMRPPSIVDRLGTGRLVTIGEQIVQQRKFLTRGWSNPTPYEEFRKGLSPLSNIIWGVNQHDVYAGRFLSRPTVMDDLLNRQSITMDTQQATTSALTKKLLNLFGVSDVISFVPLTSTDLLPLTTETKNGVTLSHYRNPTALPRAYMVNHATVAATFEEAGQILQAPSFPVGHSVLLESHQMSLVPGLTAWVENQTHDTLRNVTVIPPVTILSESHTRVAMQTRNPADSMLILTDTNYPGWKATIDAKESSILYANFTQRAIFVPAGDHTVVFTYAGTTIWRGIFVTLVTTMITVVLMVFPLFFGKHHTYQTIGGLAPRRPHNHGT